MRVESGIIVGNYEDKYSTKNPISKLLVKGFLSSLDELVKVTKAKSVHEVGCGDGFLTERVRKNLHPNKIEGSDISTTLISEAKKKYPKVKFYVDNAEKTKRDLNSFELVLACEVLEHLPHPKAALKEIHRITNGWVLLSVPQEPLWRLLNILRLKYLTDIGNTPGHINHWSSNRFLKLVGGAGFKIVEVRYPFPWTMILAKKA